MKSLEQEVRLTPGVVLCYDEEERGEGKQGVGEVFSLFSGGHVWQGEEKARP